MNRMVVGHRVGVFGLALMVCACVVATPSVAGTTEPDGAERIIAMKDLPVAVRAAAEKLIAGGTLKRVVVEREGGQDAYSVEASKGGKNEEFTFAPDGTLLAEEEDVVFAQLPEAVRVAAEKYFGARRGLHASKDVEKGVTAYEVEGRKGGEKMSVKFTAGGAQLEEEKDED